MTLSRLALSFVFLLSTALANANWFPEIGKSINTHISPPYSPSNDSDCDEYEVETSKASKELNEAHEECLNGAPPDQHYYSQDGKKTTDRCSKLACQELHTARDEFNKSKAENLKECRSTVAELKKRKQISAYISPESDENNFNSDSGVLLARKLLARYRTPNSAVALTALNISQLEKKCNATKSIKAQKACLSEIHAYASDTRKISQPNLLIRKIQDVSAKELENKQLQTLETLDNISKEEDSATDSQLESNWGGSSW